MAMRATEELMTAARAGNGAEVRRLLDADPTLLEMVDPYNGDRPLPVAAQHNSLSVVRQLVQRGANVNARGCGDKTALHCAVQEGGYQEIATFLLSKGAEPGIADCLGRTPLILGCEMGRLGFVQLLVQHMKGQGLDDTDRSGRSGLYYAAERGHGEVVAFLLSQGAQASRRSHSGETILMAASSGREVGALGVIQMLLSHLGEEGLEETDNDGRTALHRAAVAGREEVVVFLLSKGAQANSRASDGTTPITLACLRGHLGVVQILLQHLGDEGLEHMDEHGRAALDHAVVSGREDLVNFLLSRGARADSRNHHGETPLMEACRQGFKGVTGVVRILVRHTGKEGLGLRDARGRTALHVSAAKGHTKVVTFLLLSGANPTVSDIYGSTPLDLALDCDSEDEDEEFDSSWKDEERERRAKCAASFDWWQGGLERRCLLYRAVCLNKAYTTQRDMPTSQVPTYLEARVAAGHAVPSVEVASPLSQEKQQKESQAGASGKSKAAGGGDDAQKAEVNQEELHAVLVYVVDALNEELVTELLDGFHEAQAEEEEEEEEEEDEDEEEDEEEDEM